MKTINVGPMFGANETKIYLLDKSEQSKFHGFLLASGDCITCKPLPMCKMEEHCLQVVEAQKQAEVVGQYDNVLPTNPQHFDLPVYLDIVVNYDDPQIRGLPGGLRILATGENRVKRIRLTTDINCM